MRIFFPALLKKLCGQEKYNSLFYELNVVKTQEKHAEICVLLYWMFLEHLSAFFFQDGSSNSILEKNAYSKFQKDCQNKLQHIPDSEFKYPRARDKVRIDNFLPAKDQVKLMCEKVKYRLSEDDDRLMNLFSNLRNEIVHRGLREENANKILRKKGQIPNPTFKDILGQSGQFEKLIEKIFLKVLGFTSYYLHFKDIENRLFHALYWRKIPQQQCDKWDGYPHIEPLKSESTKEYFTSQNEQEKIFLTRRPQYLPVIGEILSKLKPLLKSVISDNFVKGLLTKDTISKEVEIQFQEEFTRTIPMYS